MNNKRFRLALIVILGLIVVDWLMGRILYFLDPEFRKYVDSKSLRETTTSGEKVNYVLKPAQ